MKKSFAVLALIFIVWGILSRTIFHLGANIEFVTAISISTGFIFSNKKAALTVPLLIMLISDMFIGNTRIFIFTWSGFLIPVFLGSILSKIYDKFKTKKTLKLFLFSEIAGISSSMLFFIWTNLGHWLTTTMYAKDLNGLITCYVNALPFLRPQLFSNIILVPILVITTFYVFNYSIKKELILK